METPIILSFAPGWESALLRADRFYFLFSFSEGNEIVIFPSMISLINCENVRE